MANEFKVKKGLIVTGADGGTVLDVQGSQGQLFSVTDDLSGSIFAVSDISGIPILDVNSSGTVNVDGTLNINNKVVIQTGTTYAQATDYLYIGGNDLSSGDAAIYLGNRGDGTGFGWRFYYVGIGSGNNNNLVIRSENLGSPVDAVTFNQNGFATFANTVTSPTFLGDLNGTINTATTGVTQTAGDDSTKIATTAYADAAAAAVPINDYLPLAGGTLTGDLTLTGSHTKVILDSSGHVNLELDRASTSYDANLLFKTGGGIKWRIWNDGSDNTLGIRDEVNGSEMVTFQTGGNVGIGTTSPLQPLSIENSTSPLIKIRNTTNGSGAAIEFNDNSSSAASQNGRITYYHSDSASQGGGSSYWLTGEDDQTLVLANNGRVVVQKTGSATEVGYGFYNDVNTGMYSPGADTLALATGGNNRLHINSSGNVGIGTTSPVAKLEVLGVNNDAILKLSRGNASQYLSFWGYQVASNGNHMLVSADNTKQVWLGHQSATAELVIDVGGNVGIGTTSPAYKLDVNGALHSSNITLADGIYHEGDTNTYINFLTDTIQMATSGSVRTYINSSGNVGIGTTSPGARLDVIGRVEIDAYAAQAAGNNAFDSGYLRLIGGAKTGWGIDDELGKIEFYGEDTSGVGARNAASIRAVCENGNGTSTTTFSSGLAFYTSSYNAAEGERLRINNDGNVGIGTTTPNAKLDVQGTQGQLFSVTDDLSGDIFSVADISGVPIMNVNSDGTSYFDGNVGIGTTSPAQHQSTTERVLHISNSNAASLNLDATNGDCYVLSSTAGGDFSIYNDDTNNTAFIIDDASNVGIGTTSPGARLDVVGAGDAVQIRRSNGFASIKASSDNGGNLILDSFSTSGAVFINNYVNRPVYIATGGGNVGIGTTSPDAKLDVNGTSLFRRDLTIYHKGNNSAPSYELRFKGTNSSGVDKVHASLESSPYATDTNAGTLLFKTANASNQILDTRMAIDGVGNVGIGTTSPAAKLHVLGSSSNDSTTKAEMLSNSAFSVRPHSSNSGTLAIAQVDGGNSVGMQFTNGAGTSNWDISMQPFGGNVGIGTTSPGQKLEVEGNIRLSKSTDLTSGFEIGRDGNTLDAFIIQRENADLFFRTNNSERMRINSSGNIGIGTTNPGSYKLKVAGVSDTQGLVVGYQDLLLYDNNTYSPEFKMTNNTHSLGIDYQNNETLRFITRSGVTTVPITFQMRAGTITAANFILSSDERKKTKITDLSCDNIDVSWKSFEMKDNEGEYRTGVIAQELEQNHPEFVNTDDKGFKSVKYIDLLIAKIAELEARLEKLEK